MSVSVFFLQSRHHVVCNQTMMSISKLKGDDRFEGVSKKYFPNSWLEALEKIFRHHLSVERGVGEPKKRLQHRNERGAILNFDQKSLWGDGSRARLISQHASKTRRQHDEVIKGTSKDGEGELGSFHSTTRRWRWSRRRMRLVHITYYIPLLPTIEEPLFLLG